MNIQEIEHKMFPDKRSAPLDFLESVRDVIAYYGSPSEIYAGSVTWHNNEPFVCAKIILTCCPEGTLIYTQGREICGFFVQNGNRNDVREILRLLHAIELGRRMAHQPASSKS